MTKNTPDDADNEQGKPFENFVNFYVIDSRTLFGTASNIWHN